MPRTKKTAIEEKPVMKKASKKEGLIVDVFDTKGTVSDSIELPKEMFGAKVNKALLAQAVRVYLANKRAGSHSTKTRGEVTGSTRKIYRQKGTGRARHGGVRAPIFVHGGIAHGPKPVDYSLSLTQPMKRQALFSALSAVLADKRLIIVSGFEKLAPKTKAMVAVLEKLSVIGKNQQKHALLFVELPEATQVYRIVRNVSGVKTLPANQLNAYDVLTHKNILFAKEAISFMVKHFAKKEKEYVAR